MSVEAGKVWYCFDSTQASTIARELLLNLAYQEKIQALEAVERNLEAELDARAQSFLAQHQELLAEKGITNAQTMQIALLNQNLLACQRDTRKAKRGKLAYKTLAFALACTSTYLFLKK